MRVCKFVFDSVHVRVCACVCVCVCMCLSVSSNLMGWYPHEKLLGIRRVTNPSTSIDPGSLKIGFLVLIQDEGFVQNNGTN